MYLSQDGKKPPMPKVTLAAEGPVPTNRLLNPQTELQEDMTKIIEAPLKPGEYRFRRFASLEKDGEPLMTPRDFLDSMIQDNPRPRIKSKVYTH